MIPGIVLRGLGTDVKSVGDPTDPPAPILLNAKVQGTHSSSWGLYSPFPGAVGPLGMSRIYIKQSISLCAFSLLPHSHLTCVDRDFRRPRQCAHCETGRPFFLICSRGLSASYQPRTIHSGRKAEAESDVPLCWQLFARSPRTQALHAHFSP